MPSFLAGDEYVVIRSDEEVEPGLGGDDAGFFVAGGPVRGSCVKVDTANVFVSHDTSDGGLSPRGCLG